MNPSTREETFMRGISNVLQGNSSGVSIAPSSRTEYFLNEILEAASGGGGGGGGLIVNFSSTTPDKTTAEIAAAASAGQIVVFKWEDMFAGKCVAVANITLSGSTMTGAEACAAMIVEGSGWLCNMKYSGSSWAMSEATFDVTEP